MPKDAKAARKPQHVFTMTVVSNDPNSSAGMRSRCWGYYFNRRTAARAIEQNLTDMAECGYYKYAVLCQVGEGIMALGKELQWYRFLWQDCAGGRVCSGVEKIEKPEMYKQIWFASIGG